MYTWMVVKIEIYMYFLSSHLWLYFCGYYLYLAILWDEEHSSNQEKFWCFWHNWTCNNKKGMMLYLGFYVGVLQCIWRMFRYSAFCFSNLIRKLRSDSLQLIINNLRITFHLLERVCLCRVTPSLLVRAFWGRSFISDYKVTHFHLIKNTMLKEE